MSGNGCHRLFALSLWLFAGCAAGPPPPAQLDTRNETCRHCRMAVSDRRFAAQIVAPWQEPLFFDDVGCLASHLAAAGPRAEGAVAYVADHRTGAWVPAAAAVFSRVVTLETPMASHLIAHRSMASRAADPAAAGGRPIAAAAVFAAGTLPEGR
ncbi:MAG TPA: nitrous oxide reductase accessory protein NosL [Thermoanaerobaculia bacterium]